MERPPGSTWTGLFITLHGGNHYRLRARALRHDPGYRRQTWVTISATANLPAAQQLLRPVLDANSSGGPFGT